MEPGFPRQIHVETARKWMHEMGFQVLTWKKGTFVDAHKHADIAEYEFLRRLVALGFLNPDSAPTENAKNALRADLVCPPPEEDGCVFPQRVNSPD